MVDATTPLTANSQFIQADDDDDLDDEHIPAFTHPGMATSPPPDKGKSRALFVPDQLSSPSSSNGRPTSIVTGVIGSNTSQGAPSRSVKTRHIGGVRVETRYTGTDTLDEPVSQTIVRRFLTFRKLTNESAHVLFAANAQTRDLRSIYSKLVQVLYPRRSEGREVLRDWDLWGPLLLCLGLSIMLSVDAPTSQSLGVFSSVIAICSIGALAVTVQAKLLGGRVSFFQGLCVLGYCIAPLNIAALISLFVRIIWIRAPLALLAWAWCVWASVNFLDGTKIEQQRILLAVYPLLLFYFILAWMILIQ